MSVVIELKNKKMPSCCDECWALDDLSDYPFCRITAEQRGYDFDILHKRMPGCPMRESVKVSSEVSLSNDLIIVSNSDEIMNYAKMHLAYSLSEEIVKHMSVTERDNPFTNSKAIRGEIDIFTKNKEALFGRSII